MYVFLIKDEKFLEIYSEVWKKGSNNIKRNLTVNLYTKKNNSKLKQILQSKNHHYFSQE